jgi:hypothetical protein
MRFQIADDVHSQHRRIISTFPVIGPETIFLTTHRCLRYPQPPQMHCKLRIQRFSSAKLARLLRSAHPEPFFGLINCSLLFKRECSDDPLRLTGPAGPVLCPRPKDVLAAAFFDFDGGTRCRLGDRRGARSLWNHVHSQGDPVDQRVQFKFFVLNSKKCMLQTLSCEH